MRLRKLSNQPLVSNKALSPITKTKQSSDNESIGKPFSAKPIMGYPKLEELKQAKTNMNNALLIEIN